jgi:hypothetical protein
MITAMDNVGFSIMRQTLHGSMAALVYKRTTALSERVFLTPYG